MEKVDEAKSTCCGKCGHMHVKGTSCPKPFLTGKRHCRNRKNEDVIEGSLNELLNDDCCSRNTLNEGPELIKEYLISEAWTKDEKPLGFIQFGKVTNASIHYTSGYLLQQYVQDFEGRQKPFILHSLGIGRSYLTDKKIAWHQESLNTCYHTRTGDRFPLPRYYQEKIFADQKNQVSAIKSAYSKRAEVKSALSLEKDYPDPLDQIRVKQLRIERYGELRSKRLTKDKQL